MASRCAHRLALVTLSRRPELPPQSMLHKAYWISACQTALRRRIGQVRLTIPTCANPCLNMLDLRSYTGNMATIIACYPAALTVMT